MNKSQDITKHYIFYKKKISAHHFVQNSYTGKELTSNLTHVWHNRHNFLLAVGSLFVY